MDLCNLLELSLKARYLYNQAFFVILEVFLSVQINILIINLFNFYSTHYHLKNKLINWEFIN